MLSRTHFIEKWPLDFWIKSYNFGYCDIAVCIASVRTLKKFIVGGVEFAKTLLVSNAKQAMG